jgi:hypothetical protein
VEEIRRWSWSWLGHTSQATNRPQLPLSGWQVGPKDCGARRGAVLRRLHALVGPLIHVRLNGAF